MSDKLLKRVVRRGELRAIDHDGRTYRFGAPDTTFGSATIRLTDRKAAFDLATNPRLGAGEAYMNGRLVVEEGDIADVIDLIRANAPWERGGRLQKKGLRKHGGNLLARLGRLNWERRSTRNVAHHYDLSDRLYDLFLDADRQYSCAYFTDPGNSLEQAQLDKKAHIAAKLFLKPKQRVLDIGCGWGGMALYLHQVADVDVLGITLADFYRRREIDEAFAHAWEQAVEIGNTPTFIAPQGNRRLQLRKARRVRFTEKRKAVFLAHFAGTCDLKGAAEAAGVCADTVNNHRRKDADFADAVQAALEQALRGWRRKRCGSGWRRRSGCARACPRAK